MRTLVLVVALCIAGLTLVGATVYREGLQTVPAAPDFELTSTGYENGTEGEPVTFRLSDYRNRTVVLDFMAVSCTSCRLVTENVLRPLHETFGAEVVILSIDAWAQPDLDNAWPGETREELVRLQREEDVPWRHALDTQGVSRSYQALALPKLVVVGPEGQIVDEWNGAPSLSKVRTAVVAATAGDAPAGTVWRAPPGFVLGSTALVAGVASFFAPCSIGLLPAYMGVLLEGTNRRPAAQRALLTLRGGASAAAGMVAVYVVIALMLWMLELAGRGPAVRAALPRLVPVMAVLLIVAGLLMLSQVGWGAVVRRLGPRIDGRRGFASFGAAYGLAAFGCTGPVMLPVLLAGFSEGLGMGMLVLVVYAGALATFLVAAAALVAGGHASRLRGVLAQARWVSRASAVLLVAAGGILLWTEHQAGVL